MAALNNSLSQRTMKHNTNQKPQSSKNGTKVRVYKNSEQPKGVMRNRLPTCIIIAVIIVLIFCNIYQMIDHGKHVSNEVILKQTVDEALFKQNIHEFHSTICPMSKNLTDDFAIANHLLNSLNERCPNQWFMQGGFMINMLRFGSMTVEYNGKRFVADTDFDFYYDKKCDKEVRDILTEVRDMFNIDHSSPSEDTEIRPWLLIGHSREDWVFHNIEAYYYQIKADRIVFNKYYGNKSVPFESIFPLQTAYMHGLEFPVPIDPIQMMLTLPVGSDDFDSSSEFWKNMKFFKYGSTCDKIVYYKGIAKHLKISTDDMHNLIDKCAQGLHNLGYASWHKVCMSELENHWRSVSGGT